jgi:phospholipid N-methyltransferase
MKDKIQGKINSIKNNIYFLWKFIQNPRQNASIWPTTDKTANMICESIQRNDIQTIIELWPGTWPVTKHIAKKLIDNSKQYYGIDLEKDYIDKLQTQYRNQDNMHFINGSIQNLDTIINKYNIQNIGVIISTIPYMAFAQDNQALITIKKLIDKWTIFRGISYYPPLFNKTFKIIKPKILCHTWQNIPYVFIHGVN